MLTLLLFRGGSPAVVPEDVDGSVTIADRAKFLVSLSDAPKFSVSLTDE